MKTVSDHTMKTEVAGIAKTYLDHLLQARRSEALACIKESVEAGIPLRDIYLNVLQPVMYEVGRLWQTNAIDIAVEHYITAATQLTMAHIFPFALSNERNGKKMVGGCLGSELHELGLRMVSDLFESEGWDTYFLGAVTPGTSLLRAVEEQRPNVLCLSVTMQFGVPEARDLIKTIRTAMQDACPKILVGGLPFIMNPHLVEMVGADGTGVDGFQAVTLATRLVA